MTLHDALVVVYGLVGLVAIVSTIYAIRRAK